MVRIALDAMGGDFAPGAVIDGAFLAVRELDPDHCIQLIGPEQLLRKEVEGRMASASIGSSASGPKIEIVDAPDVIDMSEKPAAAVRGKPNSSMVVGLRLQKEGASDAFVSAGNTGAQMAASIMMLRLHAGITRPAISTVLPTAHGALAVLDSGANVDCSAAELVQFARLGSVYSRTIMGVTNPRIALLSIGEESEKGNAVVKEAYQLLEKSGLNFVGNVEGRDLPAGKTDRGPLHVVVCDGFVGNIVLKLYEAMAPMILRKLALSTRPVLRPREVHEELAAELRELDYSAHGGAPLLGVKGVSIIAHGKSSSRAIKNAVLVAARAVRNGISDQIGRSLEGDAA